MAIWKLLINLGLLYITTAISVDKDSNNDSAINYRLPDHVVPIHYNIKLIPYIVKDNFTFDGESNINITIRRVTQNLHLHVLDLTINEAETLLFDNNGIIYTPAMYNYDNITQILVLHFNDKLSPGNYTLKMRYVGIIHKNTRGFFISSYINDKGDDVRWLAATNFQPTYARRVFPCWDEPALKATFNISIKHHRNYTVLSNMPIREQSDDSNRDGIIWTHFDKTPIMSTYLVAFVVTDYVRVPTEDETINIWCRSKLVPHIKFVQEIVQKSKKLLTEYTNSTSKVPKIDIVAHSFPIISTNWGLTIIGEIFLTYNESFDTIFDKLHVAQTTVHEMANLWLGNVVTPLWWSQRWLSVGFASFFQKYILNQIFKEWRIMEYFVIDIQQTMLQDINMNLSPITLKINNPIGPEKILLNFIASIHNKAPAIVRMLQHIITDEVFRNGLIKYLHTHQFSSATSDDLWNALQAVLDKSDVPHNAYRLKEVMDTWIKQSDFPVVHVTRKKDTNEIILTQEHFVPKNKSKNVNDNKWWIPLTFATQTNPDFSNTLPTHWLKPQDRNVTIDGINQNDWIIVNLQQTGYYRVNYDSTIWQKIVDYLKSDDYTKIHVLNRAQIIDDAYHFMMINQHDIIMFLNLIGYLSQETEYTPWHSMFEILSLTEDIYNVPENEHLKSYMVKILDGLIKNIGYKEDPFDNDFTKLQRTKALKWACTLGHSECKKMATLNLFEHLLSPKTHKVSPNLKEWTYCNGLMEANVSIWNKLYNIYINKPNEEILMYLVCSENPDNIINLLDIFILNNSRLQNRYEIYSSIIRQHAKNNVVVDYILINFKKTFSRKFDTNYELTGIINNVYSKDKLDEISEFVRNKFEEKVFKDVQDKIIKRKGRLDTLASFQPPNIKEKLKL